MAEAKRDGNFIATLLAVSNSDGATPVVVYADPTTHRLLVDASVSLSASTSATGVDTYRNTALSNTATAIKASAGSYYGWHYYNPNTSDVFVQLYDVAAASVVVGTTTPKITHWVPAQGALDDWPLAIPITFSTAITIAVTTTATGGTAPSSAILVDVYYK
jgi:hypothetical protein